MKLLRIYAVLLLALLAVPTAARAQTPEQRISAARQAAAASGIPVQLLESKVAEGRAKGVPIDRIAGAVEHRLSLLGRAREVMGGRPSAADLSVGADALDAGVDADALRQVAASAPADRRAMAIAVLAELVAGGETSQRALARVNAALRGGAEALRRLPGEASENSRRNSAPGRDPSRAEGGQGRGRGGPPASVPGATNRPNNGGGRGNGGGNGGGNNGGGNNGGGNGGGNNGGGNGGGKKP